MSIDKYLNEHMTENTIYKKNHYEIRIINNFFSEEILKQILDFFKEPDWKCQCIRDRNINNLNSDSPYWRIELKENELFNSYLSDRIINYLDKPLKLTRIYVVGQHYGQDSNFHIDCENPYTYTFVFYINENINDEGFFHIKIPNEKHIITIEPIMNCAVLFPSNYRHKGCGLGHNNKGLRICIAWKYELIISKDK